MEIEKTQSEWLKMMFSQISIVVKTATIDAINEVLKNQSVQVAESEFLSAAQAAALLNRKLPTIYKDVRLGKLPYYKSGPRKLLFSRIELEAYIKQMSATAKPNCDDEALEYVNAKRFIK